MTPHFAAKYLEQGSMRLSFNHMDATWFLIVAGIEESLKVNRQEFMGISLLANPVTPPYSWNHPEYWDGISLLILHEVLYILDVSALVAVLIV